jgi:hypothetical protein
MPESTTLIRLPRLNIALLVCPTAVVSDAFCSGTPLVTPVVNVVEATVHCQTRAKGRALHLGIAAFEIATMGRTAGNIGGIGLLKPIRFRTVVRRTATRFITTLSRSTRIGIALNIDGIALQVRVDTRERFSRRRLTKCVGRAAIANLAGVGAAPQCGYLLSLMERFARTDVYCCTLRIIIAAIVDDARFGRARKRILICLVVHLTLFTHNLIVTLRIRRATVCDLAVFLRARRRVFQQPRLRFVMRGGRARECGTFFVGVATVSGKTRQCRTNDRDHADFLVHRRATIGVDRASRIRRAAI